MSSPRMLDEFLFALRSGQRRRRSKLILQWSDNDNNSVAPPPDVAECREVLEPIVPAGTLVRLVKEIQARSGQ